MRMSLFLLMSDNSWPQLMFSFFIVPTLNTVFLSYLIRKQRCRNWLVACSEPSHHLKQWWFIVNGPLERNFSEYESKYNNVHISRYLKTSSGHFVSRCSMCYLVSETWVITKSFYFHIASKALLQVYDIHPYGNRVYRCIIQIPI